MRNTSQALDNKKAMGAVFCDVQAKVHEWWECAYVGPKPAHVIRFLKVRMIAACVCQFANKQEAEQRV